MRIERYEGIDFNWYYIFRGSNSEDLVLIDSIEYQGYYTFYPDTGSPYDASYYQAGIKLPAKYSLMVEGNEREFEYALSNLYLKTRNNTAPYDILLSNDRIDENLPEGTEVGILFALDNDLHDYHTFYLVEGIGSGDNDFFQIADRQLMSATTFDYENRNEFVIRVRAVDDGPYNLYYDKLLKIYVNDLTETKTDDISGEGKIMVIPNPVKDKAIIIYNNEDNQQYTFW